MIDPLAQMQVKIDNFDIARTATVYGDNAGSRWWTKGYFNNRDKGERAIEIPRDMAVKFILDQISRDEWLTRYFPKQMSIVQKSIEQARQQITGM